MNILKIQLDKLIITCYLTTLLSCYSAHITHINKCNLGFSYGKAKYDQVSNTYKSDVMALEESLPYPLFDLCRYSHDSLFVKGTAYIGELFSKKPIIGIQVILLEKFANSDSYKIVRLVCQTSKNGHFELVIPHPNNKALLFNLESEKAIICDEFSWHHMCR